MNIFIVSIFFPIISILFFSHVYNQLILWPLFGFFYTQVVFDHDGELWNTASISASMIFRFPLLYPSC